MTTKVISHLDEVVPASLSPQGIAGPRYRGAGESLEESFRLRSGTRFSTPLVYVCDKSR